MKKIPLGGFEKTGVSLINTAVHTVRGPGGVTRVAGRAAKIIPVTRSATPIRFNAKKVLGTGVAGGTALGLAAVASK